MNEKSDRMSFVIDTKLKREVQEFAKSQGMSFSSYIRSLLIKDLNHAKKGRNA